MASFEATTVGELCAAIRDELLRILGASEGAFPEVHCETSSGEMTICNASVGEEYDDDDALELRRIQALPLAGVTPHAIDDGMVMRAVNVFSRVSIELQLHVQHEADGPARWSCSPWRMGSGRRWRAARAPAHPNGPDNRDDAIIPRASSFWGLQPH